MIARCGAELGVNLAISLHAVTDDIARPAGAAQQEIPDRRIARCLPQLSRVEQCPPHHLRICDAEGRQRQPGRGARAGAAAEGYPGQGQSDPVQPVARGAYECSTDAAIKAFSDIVFAAGYSAPVRTPRGRDIFAACGQLKSASVSASAAPHRPRQPTGLSLRRARSRRSNLDKNAHSARDCRAVRGRLAMTGADLSWLWDGGCGC